MAAYLIWIPGDDQPTLDTFDSLGLGDLTTDGMPVVFHLPTGPDDKSGYLCTWFSLHSGLSAKYDSSQRWQPAKPKDDLPAGRYWLGVDPADPVTPADLERPRTFQSMEVPMADGQLWKIPLASALPRRWGLSDEGEFERVPATAAYREFCEQSAEIFKSIMVADEGESVPMVDGWQYATKALGMNYRLNGDVIDFLALIDDNAASLLFGATMEMDLIREVEQQKKTA